MERLFAGLGCLSALAAVALGAFAAHGLRPRLAPDLLNTFETGARYQMYHALGLLAVAWACGRWSGSAMTLAGWLFVAGTVVFSGSLYLLSMGGPRWLGAITPLGGLAFLAADDHGKIGRHDARVRSTVPGPRCVYRGVSTSSSSGTLNGFVISRVPGGRPTMSCLSCPDTTHTVAHGCSARASCATAAPVMSGIQ